MSKINGKVDHDTMTEGEWLGQKVKCKGHKGCQWVALGL